LPDPAGSKPFLGKHCGGARQGRQICLDRGHHTRGVHGAQLVSQLGGRARQRQETAEFKSQYALRAGAESTLSQGVRRFDLRRCRYIGLARTQLQQTLNATAMNVVRVIDWLKGRACGKPSRKVGHFAQLTPNLSSNQTLVCAGAHSPTESVLTGFVLLASIRMPCSRALPRGPPRRHG